MRGGGETGASRHDLSLRPELARASSEPDGWIYDWRGEKIEAGAICYDKHSQSEVLVRELTFGRSGLVNANVVQLRSGGPESFIPSDTVTCSAAQLLLLHRAEESPVVLARLGLPADGRRPNNRHRFEDGVAYDWRGSPLHPGTEVCYPNSSRFHEMMVAVIQEVEELPKAPRLGFGLRVVGLTGRNPRWIREGVPLITALPPLPAGITRPKDIAEWRNLRRSAANLDRRGVPISPGERMIYLRGSQPTEIDVISLIPGFPLQGRLIRSPGGSYPGHPTASLQSWDIKRGIFLVDASEEETGRATVKEECSLLLSVLADAGVDLPG